MATAPAPARLSAIKRLGWGALILVLLILFALLTWEPLFALDPGPPPPARAYKADIARDSFGVPHIHGATDPDVAFGIAWAHAEDDFSTLQETIAMARGRLGALSGQEGAAVDFAYHLLDSRGTATRNYAALPADVRLLIEGYASGLNRYAAVHPGEVRLARLFPVSGLDIATGFALRQPFFFGLDRTLGPLVKGEPFEREHGPVLDGSAWPDYAHGGGDMTQSPSPPPSPPLAALPIPMGENGALAGSNAFAIAPARSGDGVTRLVSNSHQPYRGGTAWYELEVDSDAGWHMAGATFPGMPLVALGHNETLGWTNTVNRPDLTDIYKLVLDADQTHYRLDGKWLPLEKHRVILPVKFGPFVLPIPKTVWRTQHGPAVINARGAYAIRYSGMGNSDNLTEYYKLNRARNWDEWQAALAMQGIPSTNFIYADNTGRIAYIYNARTPVRKPGLNWRGVLPGDRSDLIWNAIEPYSALPHYVSPRSGFLYNSNNTPFTAAGAGSDLDPKTFPPEFGIELDLTNRGRRAARLLTATNPIGRNQLEAIKYDTGYERAGYVAAMLDAVAALDLRGNARLAKAQTLLGAWDLKADGNGPADALAVMVLEDAMAASYNLRQAPDARESLAKAANHLMRYFGRLDPPLGEVIRLRRGNLDLALDGGGDTLRAATSWDKDAPDGRLPIHHGDSFIMFVEWPAGGGPVRSESIQPYGAATTRPLSPHFNDQAPLFAAHRLKPVWFTRADVAAHAVRHYTVENR